MNLAHIPSEKILILTAILKAVLVLPMYLFQYVGTIELLGNVLQSEGYTFTCLPLDISYVWGWASGHNLEAVPCWA